MLKICFITSQKHYVFVYEFKKNTKVNDSWLLIVWEMKLFTHILCE